MRADRCLQMSRDEIANNYTPRVIVGQSLARYSH